MAGADGLLLVAGCEDGSLGRLDVLGRAHTSLVTSHCSGIVAIERHPSR
jgi:hypothetical protein